MKELIDLELCRKIAEIERVPFKEINGVLRIIDTCESIRTGNEEYTEYNPLGDDSVLFSLMVNYNLTINTSECWVECPDQGCYVDYGQSSELPRAMLECIIEAGE
tara:strand:+ start:603 stop:917 length:315 start_codon:yes stop_codon:yes gene_type:complete